MDYYNSTAFLILSESILNLSQNSSRNSNEHPPAFYYKNSRRCSDVADTWTTETAIGIVAAVSPRVDRDDGGSHHAHCAIRQASLVD